MGKSDLDVIRDHYAATNERDFARAMSHYAEDVVLTVSEELAFAYTGTFRGKEAVGEFFGDWFRSFDSGLYFEITELTELEGGSILLVADVHVRGRTSGIELTQAVIWAYRVRDGRIVGVEGFETPDAAREAAAAR